MFGLTNELTIVGTGTAATYQFTVTGDLASNPDEGTFDTGDAISGGSVEGSIIDGTDSYLFSGIIADFSLDGDAEVYLDDAPVDPADLGLDNELQIVGSGVETAQYEFAVDGELVANPDLEPEASDSITGNIAKGAVSDGTDSYLYSGEITEFVLDGEAGVYRNGEQVHPDRLGGNKDPVLPNLFVVDGTGGTASEYAMRVTGDVAKSPDLGSIEQADVIEGKTVGGSVDGEVDGYRFSGNVARLLINGTADVTFEVED